MFIGKALVRALKCGVIFLLTPSGSWDIAFLVSRNQGFYCPKALLQYHIKMAQKCIFFVLFNTKTCITLVKLNESTWNFQGKHFWVRAFRIWSQIFKLINIISIISIIMWSLIEINHISEPKKLKYTHKSIISLCSGFP